MKLSVKKMVLIAMLAAVSYVVVSLVKITVVHLLKNKHKEVIITIGGFMQGPWAVAVCSLVVSLLEMTISETGPIGALMNFLSTCCFSCTAAWIYKKRHTLSGAVWGLACGSVVMVSAMLLWNWLITPLYMGVPRDQVQALLIPAFLPFNALKAGLNTALTLALYKPLVSTLRRTGLVESHGAPGRKSKAGIYVLAGVLLVTCILLLLTLRGIL